MAIHVAKAMQSGDMLKLWNRTLAKSSSTSESAIGETQEVRIMACSMVEEAVAGADVVISMLSDGPVNDRILFGIDERDPAE